MTGLQNHPESTSENVNKNQPSSANLFAALGGKCSVEEPHEDSWRMKLNLSTNSQLPPLNDSELWEDLFVVDDNDLGKNLDVGGDAVSPQSVLDEQFEFRKCRSIKFRRRRSNNDPGKDLKLTKTRRKVATDYSHGGGCGKLVSSLFREEINAMDRVMPYPTELPAFQVCSANPQAELVVIPSLVLQCCHFNSHDGKKDLPILYVMLYALEIHLTLRTTRAVGLS
jgi:hypothetical protein